MLAPTDLGDCLREPAALGRGVMPRAGVPRALPPVGTARSQPEADVGLGGQALAAAACADTGRLTRSESCG